VPTAITALPAPATRSPEAAAAYMAGLTALRDDDWGAAGKHFDRAAELDPDMAEAAVQRMVVHEDSDGRDMWANRRMFQTAWQMRAKLSPRDLALLDAFEPAVAREPQDNVAYRVKIAAATRAFPGDVQIASLAANEIADTEQALAAYDRVIGLDAQHASAWQQRARRLLMLGRVDEALASFERCLSFAPASQCLEERAAFWAEAGECAKMATDARAWVARSAGDPYAYYLLANALARDGAPDDAVLEALRQRAAGLAGEERAIAARVEPARVDVLRGRFERAEEQARALTREIDASPNVQPHAAAARLLVDVLLETGRTDEAGRVAGELLARSGVWNHTSVLDGAVPAMLDARVRAGAMTRAEATARADAWIEGERRSAYLLVVPYLWAFAHAIRAATREDAEAALSRQDLPFPAGQAYLPVTPVRAYYGHVLALAGREGGIAELRKAAGNCATLVDPFVHTRAHAWLGEALEARGDKPGACAAYAVVLDRWGAAKPPSVTAQRASARFAALGCAR
jgi:serine/threonine-protein kinase